MNTFAAILVMGFAAVAVAHVPLGKYETTGRMENTEAFSVASGTPHVNDTIYNEFTQNGDEYVHKFSVPSANYHQELPFKLGEQRTGQYRGKDFTYKYYMDEGHLKAHFDGNNKHIKHSYKTEGDGYIKEYKTGNVMAKVWYKKSQQ
ncbi:SAHS3 [Ramazzottius varieornatus]|uniref:SAHS3 n=1 Tax=Ramazzottius varieornatus TaxID=947166 RepID=A0A1D1UKM2_RAMVA|nr:SAHS3 [Ramazzottius varieornatus]